MSFQEKGGENLYTNYLMSMQIIRKSDFIKVNGYDESIMYGAEDWDLWLNMLNHSMWGYVYIHHYAQSQLKSLFTTPIHIYGFID